MTQIETSLSDWEKCKPGSLVGYAARDKSRKSRRRIIKVIGVSSVCVVALFASITLIQPVGTGLEPNYGGIVCSNVMNNSDLYLTGKLDENTTSKIDKHLKLCSKCRSSMSLLKKSQDNKTPHKAHPQRLVSAPNNLDTE